MIAIAFRENRPKNRDLRDIAWLARQGIELPAKLIPVKIADHKRGKAEIDAALRERLEALKIRPVMRIDFVKEMQRFLPPATVRGTIESPAYWDYIEPVRNPASLFLEVS